MLPPSAVSSSTKPLKTFGAVAVKIANGDTLSKNSEVTFATMVFSLHDASFHELQVKFEYRDMGSMVTSGGAIFSSGLAKGMIPWKPVSISDCKGALLASFHIETVSESAKSMRTKSACRPKQSSACSA